MDENQIIISVSFLKKIDIGSYIKNDDGTVEITLGQNGTVFGLDIESESVSFNQQKQEEDAGIIYNQSVVCAVAFDKYNQDVTEDAPGVTYAGISGFRGVLLFKYQNGTQKSIGTDTIPGQIFVNTSSTGFSTQLQISFDVTGLDPSPNTTVV